MKQTGEDTPRRGDRDGKTVFFERPCDQGVKCEAGRSARYMRRGRQGSDDDVWELELYLLGNTEPQKSCFWSCFKSFHNTDAWIQPSEILI